MLKVSARVPPDIKSSTELARLLGVTRQRADQLLHPERRRARQILRSALKTGKLVKPAFCFKCRRGNLPIQSHHIDYHFPLMVIWLCEDCHNEIKKPRYDNRRPCKSDGCIRLADGSHGLCSLHAHRKERGLPANFERKRWDRELVLRKRTETGFGPLRLARLLGVPVPTVEQIIYYDRPYQQRNRTRYRREAQREKAAAHG